MRFFYFILEKIMTKISGILTGGDNKPINGTIVFTAKKTTSKVIENTQVLIDVANGNYSLDLLPCDYDVILMIVDHPKYRLGSIRVLADSRNGSLNDFLLNPAESEVTPELLQQVIELRDSAKKSADDAKKNAETIDVSAYIKKTGDTIDGQLVLNYQSSGIKFYTENNNIYVIRTLNDDFKIMYYDQGAGKWSTKCTFSPVENIYRFDGVNDVKINGKSILKTGDAVQIFGDLADKSLNELTGAVAGNYFQGRNALATAENGYPINEAGVLNVMSNGADGDGCCQIYTTYRNARQFIRNYRGGIQSWEPWIEQITTNNSTVDSNGFYKKSSPILRLYGIENIENVDGFTNAGVGLVNNDALGVTAKRIDVGHYEIHGSLGFSKEGWYIQLPEDANGNKKFFAEYSVNKKNIITVKTFTKKFDFEKCEVVAGEPVDITDGRWIDVRLEMPVVEPIETAEVIESTESATNELEPVESIKADKQSNNPL